MKYHLVVGLLGSGQTSFSEDLLDVITEARGSRDSCALVHWGRYENVGMDNSRQFTQQILDRCLGLRLANPDLTDVIITGPGLLEHWLNIDQLGARTVYWIDRVDHSECRHKSINFWEQKLKGGFAQNRFEQWLDRHEQLWLQHKPQNLSWATLQTLVWDQDTQSVVLIPADSRLSYLKQVAVEHFQ
jgi:hypothetical protein